MSRDRAARCWRRKTLQFRKKWRELRDRRGTVAAHIARQSARYRPVRSRPRGNGRSAPIRPSAQAALRTPRPSPAIVSASVTCMSGKDRPARGSHACANASSVCQRSRSRGWPASSQRQRNWTVHKPWCAQRPCVPPARRRPRTASGLVWFPAWSSAMARCQAR